MSKFKEGDLVRIVANESLHEFPIGTKVKITKVRSEGDYRADSDDDYWFVGDDEIELIMEKPESE